MNATERPGDQSGPHPENQLKRVELRKARHSLVGMLAVVALATITFAVLRRSDDRFLGLPPGYLRGSGGLLLAVLIAVPHALAAVLVATRATRARLVAAIAASLLIGAGASLFVSQLGVAWLPALLVFVGFLELLLVAGSTPRKPARSKHVPGRR